MSSTGTSEGSTIHCPICTKRADAAQIVCPACSNALAFPDPTLLPITLAAFPILDRDLIERLRKLVNEVKPLRVRIDFASVQLPSPGAYAIFMLLVKDVKKLGSVLAVRNVDPKIHDMFVITRVDGLIETEPPA